MRLKPGVTGPGFSQTEQLDRRPRPLPANGQIQALQAASEKAWWGDRLTPA